MGGAENPVEWVTSPGFVPYPQAIALMEARVEDISAGKARELVWLLEHPPLYTAGSSANPRDLIAPGDLPVFAAGRGGQYTYHGPGQRIVYLMLDLTRRQRDVRRFVAAIEQWIIEALGELGVAGAVRHGRTGVWVSRPEKGPDAEDKIAAIGLRVRRWVTFHGVSINVSPDLRHYDGIVACGIRDQGVTSLADLGVKSAMTDLDTALHATFLRHFDLKDKSGSAALALFPVSREKAP